MPNIYSMTGYKDAHRKELCIRSNDDSIVFSTLPIAQHQNQHHCCAHFSSLMKYFRSTFEYFCLMNSFNVISVLFIPLFFLYYLIPLPSSFSQDRFMLFFFHKFEQPLISQTSLPLHNLMRCATFRHTSFAANFSISIYFSWGFARFFFAHNF